ncbi:MAG: hypothetical protein ABL967_01580 [Bryobacteraceae bacterium]
MSKPNLWLWGMLLCLVTLSFVFPIPRVLVGSCVSVSLFYLTLGPQKHRKTTVLFLVFSLSALIALISWDEHTFNAMPPSQHLAAARKAQAEGNVGEGLRHTSAIPANASEKPEANSIAEDLQVKLTFLRRAAEEERQAKKARITVVPEIESDIKNRGYAVNVSRSDVPGEIIMTSKDFGDTDRRVRFLQLLRGRNGPAELLCLRGYRTVRLNTSTLPILGFNEQYSLDCYGSR